MASKASNSPKLSLTTAIPLPHAPCCPPMPQLGFGTYQSPPQRALESCIAALDAGYRHIDTAQYYANEEQVGRAIVLAGLRREDVFVTTKILTPRGSVEANYASCLESVGKIGTYVDCFLIHSPNVGEAEREALWLALERLYREGRARSIGVSNFGRGHIERLRGVGDVWPPHVNQIELHPWHQQRDIVRYCGANGIVVQAYCPIVRNLKANDATLQAIAARLGVTPNQVLIRWGLQKGWVSLPKSDNPGRIWGNADVFGFELGAEDEALLDGLDQGADGAIVQSVNND